MRAPIKRTREPQRVQYDTTQREGEGVSLHLDLALILLFNLPQSAPARDQYFCHEVPLNNPNSLAADQKNDVHHDTKQGSEWGFPYIHS